MTAEVVAINYDKSRSDCEDAKEKITSDMEGLDDTTDTLALFANAMEALESCEANLLYMVDLVDKNNKQAGN